MLFNPLVVATLLNAISVVANPTWSAMQEYSKNLPKHLSKHQGTRPKVDFSPKQPYQAFSSFPSRDRVCYVSSHKDSVTDDSPYILDAINKCNPGGHVIFSEGTKYIIGTALDLTNLTHIDLGKPYHSLILPIEHLLTSSQTSKATSNSQMTPTTGKQTASSKPSKTQPPSSSLAAQT